MRAAAERPVGVDHALAGLALEQWTCAVVGFGEFLAASGAETFGGDEGFAFGEVRREAGEVKLATFGARDAIARDRSLSQFGIHRPDFSEGLLDFFLPHVSKGKD